MNLNYEMAFNFIQSWGDIPDEKSEEYRTIWDKIKGNELPSGIDVFVFDTADSFQSISKAVDCMCYSVNLTGKGIVTDKLIKEIEIRYPENLLGAILAARLHIIMGLTESSHDKRLRINRAINCFMNCLDEI